MPLDFSHHNLRGRSFKALNLESANFSYANIQSADFTNANLRGANFSHAKAGSQKRNTTILVLISWLLSAFSGFFSGLTSYVIGLLFKTSNLDYQIAGLVAIVIVIIFFAITIRQGIPAGLGAVALTGAIAVVIAGALTLANQDIVLAAVAAITVAVTLVVTIAVAAAVAVTVALAGVIAVAIAVAIAVTVAVAVAVALPKALAAVVAAAGAVAFALLSVYIGWRSLQGDKKYALIRNIVIAFAAWGGTSFRNADLTDADFTGATLKSTDLRNANLTRTCFKNTKQFDLVRPGSSYLQNAQVRQVLITGQGQDKNFDGQVLRGVNFRQANLQDASFIGADLSEANLQDADLSRAKLVQTQLDRTDFTGVTLTGAYIEDWGITGETKFDEVRCEYVYMRLPTKEKPDPYRKPDNTQEVFADGDFGDFIKPIVDTLDIYHNQRVDPRAIAIAFKELAEIHPEAELEIVAIEKRGEDKILLRAKTAETANKSELSRKYFINYNHIKSLAEREIRALIKEKNVQIRRLENMIMTTLERPNFYAQNYYKGDITMTDNRTINMGDGNYNESIQGKSQYIQGDYYAAGQKQSLAEAVADIQQLFNQLQKSNPTASETVVAALAADEIKNNPTMKARVIGALKSGGKEAFKEAVDNPVVNILVAIIEGWQSASN